MTDDSLPLMNRHHRGELPREESLDLTTHAVGAGEREDCSSFPIYQSNTADGGYARHGNPTISHLEEKFQKLEGGSTTLAMACGMAAVSHSLLTLLGAGDRLVAHRNVFSGVQTLFADFLPRYGIEVEQIDMRRPREVERALAEPPRLVYLEVVSNRYLEVFDLPAIIAQARRAGSLVLVDNTFFTPCLLKPLTLGADLVVHSASKYLCGHGDALGGLITAREPDIGQRLNVARRILGGVSSPQNAHLLSRGLKTLALRMERHSSTAHHLARELEGAPGIERVLYPGLASFPDHRIAASFLDTFGGVLLLELDEELDWPRFLEALRICRSRYSYGEPTTLVHRLEPRKIRVAAGLEHPRDLLDDLRRAFAAARRGRRQQVASHAAMS